MSRLIIIRTKTRYLAESKTMTMGFYMSSNLKDAYVRFTRKTALEICESLNEMAEEFPEFKDCYVETYSSRVIENNYRDYVINRNKFPKDVSEEIIQHYQDLFSRETLGMSDYIQLTNSIIEGYYIKP